MELVEALLRRIGEADRVGPELRSVLALCPDALETAHRMDQERRHGEVRGPLHGIPVLVKDNIDTAGSEGTTAGSLALAMTRAHQEMPSSCNGSGKRAPSSSASPTSPSGRTSEASVPRAAGARQAVSAAIPTRSTGRPAAPAPDPGRESRPGSPLSRSAPRPTARSSAPPHSTASWGSNRPSGSPAAPGSCQSPSSQDTVGPMATKRRRRRRPSRCSRRQRRRRGPARPDDDDAPRSTCPRDYRAFCDFNGLSGARIGVPRQHYFGYSAKADALVEAALAIARKAGAVIIDPADVPTAKSLSKGKDELTVMLHEYKAGLEAYLANPPGRSRSTAHPQGHRRVQRGTCRRRARVLRPGVPGRRSRGRWPRHSRLPEGPRPQLAKGAPGRDRRRTRGGQGRCARLSDDGAGVVHRPRQR